MKIKTITTKAEKVDTDAKELSEKMSKTEYTITAEKINPPLIKMKRIIRMMGFKNAETDAIIDSVRKDLVGKEMHKGDNFHELIKEAFTKAIQDAVKEIKRE